jgi:hypothetical protein
MSSTIFRAALIGGTLVAANLAPTAGHAHHSFASEFDVNQPFQIAGTVKAIEWTNPHGRLHVDVEEETGEIVTYDFELASPNSLMRQGWSRNDLKPGDRIRVSGHRARNRPTVGRVNGISRENGEAVFGGGVKDDDASGGE